MNDEDIDRLGTILENAGFSHSEIDAHFLEHYGVRGMKWGVRKGRGTTGVSRSRGAVIDRNDRIKDVIGKAASGEKYKLSVAVGKKILGEQKQKENWNRMVKDLNDQNERLRTGKLTLGDRLSVIGGTTIGERFVSVRPKD